VRAEIVAVGTELLLGQIVDTNSAWIGEQLALAGIDCNYQTKVGDNLDRIVLSLRAALARNEAVVICGGLGPTQDDITREAIAEVMGVRLERHDSIVGRIAQMFASRGREMPDSNLRQADVPVGATVIEQRRGTAPGLICPVGHKVMYAVPGVPHEMREMVERSVLPDLMRRAAERGEQAVIVSRVMRTWGTSESALAEMVAPRYDALQHATGPATTIAFLASGIEGMKVRVTAKGATAEEAQAAADAEAQALALLLGEVVFSTDDETMEAVVASQLLRTGRTLAVAESLTGGLLASRLVAVEGAGTWFRGGVVSYATEAKHDLLGVPADLPVVSAGAAQAMAAGAARVLGASVGLSTTGVAGPTEQDGQPVGTVFVGLAIDGQPPTAVELHLPGDRERVRQFSTISALDLLRRRLGAPA
jgi:nicotinamide-nucleotide amidase